MSLRDEVERFSRLSGEDGEHTSIGRIGSFLDGYDKALEQTKRKRGKWVVHKDGSNKGECSLCGAEDMAWKNFCPICGADMRGNDND